MGMVRWTRRGEASSLIITTHRCSSTHKSWPILGSIDGSNTSSEQPLMHGYEKRYRHSTYSWYGMLTCSAPCMYTLVLGHNVAER